MDSVTNEEASGKKRVEKKPEATSTIENQIYFSIIPEWIIDCDIPAQSKVLYAILQRYADKNTGECYPSIATISKRMRVSESTVKRSMTHLITIGALKKEARYDIETGEQTSNLYTVIQAPPVTSELPPSSPTTYKPKSINQRKDIGKVIFVKLTEAIGRTPVTKSDRAGWNKVVKELKEAEINPDDIPKVVDTYKEYYKGMTLSPYAIAKHWSLMLQIYEETKPKEPYNCEKSGHKWRDLGVIFYCPHCTAEKSK
ncbi:MAG: hypothetical protein Tp156SUR915002_19 [Prokaryotic dsDNA virus sp.]|jgi:rubredoxin|nr:MAG: hypothetical protein Tp162SUR384061_28 [Prokaryotic dsDNA virus sp.]QDP59758.1 MAG: hypothetical protein Tp156SUR915002_19 [Prokaryotic dsDNA virus sp.]|tara:strand:+ start:20428 stop:21195 length:768 start_codon:yes stop_codon:yes gene_type:complete